MVDEEVVLSSGVGSAGVNMRHFIVGFVVGIGAGVALLTSAIIIAVGV